MVHNGIEYADMQMIAEVYGLLRDGAQWPADRIGREFAEWNRGKLASYLTEITAQALAVIDPQTGAAMVDVILDKAGQKGTGRWTVIEALKLGQSASVIEAAVGARAWSSDKAGRVDAAQVLAGVTTPQNIPQPQVLAQALLAGRILAHAQGFRLLHAASDVHDWSLDLARIAQIWRAGCIIRSALLDDLAAAFHSGVGGGDLLQSTLIQQLLAETIGGLRQVVAAAAMAGLPVPALGAALSWYDSARQARGTANLIQAQRDIFGAHGFQRTDAEGQVHADWNGSGDRDREGDN